MNDDPDCVAVGDDVAWLEPTPEIRFIERGGLRILQQKWSASGTAWEYGHQVKHTRWRWKDVPLDLNPERDCVDDAG